MRVVVFEKPPDVEYWCCLCGLRLRLVVIDCNETCIDIGSSETH